MDLTNRQEKILKIVKENAPITGDDIAKKLNLSRATLRPDLTILTMMGILGARPKVGYFYSGKSELSLAIDKIKKLKVKDFMSVPVVMDEKTSIYDVIVNIFLEDISSVFITENGYLAGVVSRKDLIRSTIGNIDLKNTPIALIMTRMPNIICVKESTSAYDAAKLIDEKGVDALPVVSIEGENFSVVGRFTKTNVTRLFVDICSGEII